MRTIARVLVITMAGVAFVTLAVMANNYLNDHTYNKCMIANAKYTHDTDRNCKSVYELGD
jgi:hypothetical protein